MYCATCHYPLSPSTDNRCTECGREFNPSDPRTYLDFLRITRRSRPFLSIAASFVVSSALLGGLAAVAWFVSALQGTQVGMFALAVVAVFVAVYSAFCDTLSDRLLAATGATLAVPAVFVTGAWIINRQFIAPARWVLLATAFLFLFYAIIAVTAGALGARTRRHRHLSRDVPEHPVAPNNSAPER